MLYREAGQFKTDYASDQQIFPILQDRIFVVATIVLAFLAVPMIATPYLYTEILIPFLILSLAAVGLNILVGYCGQVSLGTGGFMAVGAYAAYNLWLRVPELNNLVVVFLFVVMLLNLRRDEFPRPRQRLTELAGVVLALGVAGAFIQLVPKALPTVREIPADFGGYRAVGRVLYTDFVLPFEITSLLLLAAIVGAVVLAKRRLG